MEKSRREVSMGFTAERFPEGHHIIYLYNDDHERKRTMAKFLRQGWIDHEKLLYLVDDITPDEMRKELAALGVDLDEAQCGLEVTRGHHTLCPGEYFTPEFMLGVVGEYYKTAIQDGYAGARGAGEMSWALIEGRATVPDLLHYEANLNRILSDYPLTTVCQYDARRFDGALVMDMLSVHPMMIVRGQLVKNPSYVEPDVFLREYTERLEREAGWSH